MKAISFLLMLFFSIETIAQTKSNFDIVSYLAPKGWLEESKENMISYSIVDKSNNSWCQISIVKSTVSKGSVEKDFESEWRELIVSNYKISDPPQESEVQESGGWRIKSGAGKFTFNNSSASAALTTISGYNLCVSVVATTNSQEYVKDLENFLNTVELKKPDSIIAGDATAGSGLRAILGAWRADASGNSSYRVNNGVMNYISRQYVFNDNGSYSFTSKAFDPFMDKILLAKESGTFTVAGNTINIKPAKSIMEGWSKKNSSDNWGKLLETQKIPLEMVSYQFVRQYNGIFKEWQLILQADKVTKRDGPFNHNSGWIYIVPSPARPIIKLPGE